MDDLSVEHLAWLKRQNDRAPNTLTSRRRVLKSVGNAGTATREQVEAWWESRAALEPGSRAVDLSHLRGFYKWCQIYDHRADDPSIRVRTPRVPHKIAKRARPAELATLLDSDMGDDLKRAVMLGAYAGLRISESAALDWSDVDDDADTIIIRESKGGKSRIINVSPTLIDWMGAPAKGSVVTAGDGWYSAPQLQTKLNRAIRRLGLTVTTHSLRHRFGVAAYQISGDLLAVAEMMGHSSVQTTQIYAEASSDVKKKIATGVMR